MAAAAMSALKLHSQRPLKRDLRAVHMHMMHVNPLDRAMAERTTWSYWLNRKKLWVTDFGPPAPQ